jgi:hypothetical protein
MTYKTRQSFETITLANPNEDITTFKEVLEEISSHGYNSLQWSDTSSALGRPGNYKKFKNEHPEYDRLPLDEQCDLSDEWEKTQPNWFFIEAFGSEQHGYLRGEGETFLACAQSILKQVHILNNCSSHEWAYTHSNGNKTCKLCHRFEPCSVEEALAHYTSGQVKFDEHRTLTFDHENPLCSCGSHQTYYLSKSLFPEKKYICVSCHTFIARTPSPDYSDRLPTDLKGVIKSKFGFQINKKLTAKSFSQALLRFTQLLYDHAHYVENISDNEFEAWSLPHLACFATTLNASYTEGDKLLSICGISSIKVTIADHVVTSLTPGIRIAFSDENKETPEESFARSMDILVNAFAKKDS